ncbi:Myomegalin [Microtus ochrogaster]|uniref:Myomegalin n=1 Tax=Microtus ochrogaster TaxID=79684 RepID=A0A8J6GGA4_MICOH|nr:Myomegalin [Microtus ochrogaster]
MGAEELNLGPHASTEALLATEPPPGSANVVRIDLPFLKYSRLIHLQGPHRTNITKSLSLRYIIPLFLSSNIELKIEVESLKRELRDRKQHLEKTRADVEDLNSQNEAELRRQVEERQQETEHVYELLENKIQLLQEESRLAKNEAARMAALVEVEKGCNLELSEKLKDAAKDREDAPGDRVKPDQYSEALAQRDRRIEELRQSLAAQEGLVEQLSQEKQKLLHMLEEPESMEVQLACKVLIDWLELVEVLRCEVLRATVLSQLEDVVRQQPSPSLPLASSLGPSHEASEP